MSQITIPKYPVISEDEVLIDWFAAATNRTKNGDWRGWESADACLAFTDIGPRDTDDGESPRGQIVMFAYLDDNRPSRAISLEIDADDAFRLAERLTAWAYSVQPDGPMPPSEAFDAARAKVTPDTPCTRCGQTMPDEFLDDGTFEGVMNNRLKPFHHGCEDF